MNPRTETSKLGTRRVQFAGHRIQNTNTIAHRHPRFLQHKRRSVQPAAENVDEKRRKLAEKRVSNESESAAHGSKAVKPSAARYRAGLRPLAPYPFSIAGPPGATPTGQSAASRQSRRAAQPPLPMRNRPSPHTHPPPFSADDERCGSCVWQLHRPRRGKILGGRVE